MLKLLRQLGSRALLTQIFKPLQNDATCNQHQVNIEKSYLEQKAYLREAFHELRNSVHVITGNSALLSKWTDDSRLPLQAIRVARNIREASQNMLQFLNAGMELAKPDGSYQRKWETLHIRPWLQAVMGAYQHHLDEKRLTIEFNMANSFPAYIQMDILLFRQVVTNLLQNAIRYSPSGNRIRIDCFEGSHEWTMAFINKAVGIDQDKLKHIFEPWHTLGHPESNSGLGLNITRKYVGMLGGVIKASTIKDQFVIWMRLPMQIVSAKPAQALLERTDNVAVIHGARKVLVMEDNPLSQRLICNYLYELGLRQIAVVADAKGALRLAKQLRPDLVFMDVHLPGHNGVKTVQALKTMLKDTPVIAMTGDGSFADNAPLLEAGASEYILKPFELHDIAGIIQKYLVFAS